MAWSLSGNIRGAVGASGAQGASGVPGAQGASGPQGEQGLTGLRGPTGASGEQGASGIPGGTGGVGPQGASGVPGSDATVTTANITAALGYTPESASSKGVANGYASLDSGGKVPITQLPSSIMEYQGTYNATTNSPSLTDGTGSTGDVYRVTVAGTQNFGAGAISFNVGDYVIYNGTAWEKSDTTDAVSTVATLTGDISASSLRTALSINNVDNTSDASKPISTATQTALNAKEPTIAGATSDGQGLNTNKFWRGDKSWVVLSKTNVGLANVDNTSDATKNAAATTLTNKRITLRVNSTTSSATPAINTDTTDQFNITALATAITSMTSSLTGTPTDGQRLLIRIKDNGTARTITWGASFISSGAASLPTTTVASRTHMVGLIYDSVAAKWVCAAVDTAGY